MEINYHNYVDLDEQEMRQDEEKQIKEIQDLLVNELDGIEIDDNDYSNDESSCDFQEDDNKLLCKTLDEDASRYEIESPNNDNNAKENNFYPYFNQINTFVPNWPGNAFPQFCNIPISIGDNKNNFQYAYQQTNNNGIVDSSINWEISLYDEMGVSRAPQDGKFLSEKFEYSSPSNSVPTQVPSSQYPKLSHNSEIKVITRDVAIECIPATQRELDNLELLYSARGKRIEELQQELELEREKRMKETRICNHKVMLMEGELKSQSNVMKRSMQELEEQHLIVTNNEQIISHQSEQIDQLNRIIEELREKSQSNSIVIDSLNEQIAELTSTNLVSKSNQNQSDLLDCINRQFDTDSQRLKSEIYRLSGRVDEKTREIDRLETLLDEKSELQRKEKENWKAELDRIQEELECERKNCKELEKCQSQKKIEELNREIGDLNLRQSLDKDLTNYLEEQVENLSHQLLVYEKSMNLLDIADAGFGLNQTYWEQKNNYHRSSCPILSTVGRQEMDNGNIESSTDHYNILELQKQLFELTKRTHSLTNRLMDVRKINLDSKSSGKKFQKLAEDYRQSKENLEGKITEMEKRMKEIQSGEETTAEKHLKISIESLKTINSSLEQECKNLQNQLKQATSSMAESDRNYKQLDKEFEAFKQFAHEDKETSIEHIRQVCSNHYDNLREQLEQSWMSEKDLLMEEANCQREKILRDLSDAINEVDRVKNLYIQLSQQKSNEDSERTNWNEWLEKKLQEQKRSLNQQFKIDQENIIKEIRLQHREELENMKSEIDRRVPQHEKAVGTDRPGELSISVIETQDSSVQVDSLKEIGDLVEELRSSNRKLETVVSDLEGENAKIRKEYEMINCQKLAVENENLLLSSKVTLVKSPSTDSEKLNCVASNRQNVELHNQIPNIIRSTTPQLILESKRNSNSSSNTRVSTTKIHQQFKLLKEDLINQLSKIPNSIPIVDYSSDHISCVNGSHSIMLSSIDSSSEREVNEVKQKLYNVVLDIQARAASTLQLELQKAQIIIRKSLLEKIRSVIPILLSVDGQLIDIPASKIKILSDRIIMMLNHLETDDDGKLFIVNPANSSFPFSSTSTPRNHKSPLNFLPNISIIKLDDACNGSCDETINSNKERENLLQEKCVKLKDEISQLSEALNKYSSQNISSFQTFSPFQNVDKSILSDIRYSQ